MIRGLVTRVRQRDPEGDAGRRALRAAIVIPVAAAVSFAVAGLTQTPMFTIVGSIALLIVADFPGDVRTRALAYLGLGGTGAALIVVGTLAAPIPWVSIPLCFAVGVLVSFLGLLSEVVAAGQRAVLTAFLLALCTVPVGPLPDRLLGWLIALVICVPAALFLFPARYSTELRRHAATVCAALADRIGGDRLDDEQAQRNLAAATEALDAAFRGSVYRPVNLTAGSRALLRVVSNLDWLADRVDGDTGRLLGSMAPTGVQVLRGCAEVLDSRDNPGATARLAGATAQHRATAFSSYHGNIAAILEAPDDATAVEMGGELLTRRVISATIGATGRLIAAAEATDARPPLDRLLGRGLPDTGVADRVYTNRTVLASLGGYISTRAVTVFHSLRVGLALALAFTVTVVFPVQHGVWVVLGALSVLRGSLLSTGTSLLRAVAGTVIGFAIGAALFWFLGVNSHVLWALLPLAAFGSTYVLAVGSFTASQAMFTMMVLIMFNIVAPVGWQAGLVRLEDVLMGAAVGLVVSVLLWPRGAATAVERSAAAAMATVSRYLAAAVVRVTRGASEQADDTVFTLRQDSVVTARTHNDAMRNYVSEVGGAIDPRLTDANNRSVRVRFSADLIADVVPPPLTTYRQARSIIEARALTLCARLEGDPLDWIDSAPAAPISDELVPALRREADAAGPSTDRAAAAALPLVTVAANLAELELLYPATVPDEPVPA